MMLSLQGRNTIADGVGILVFFRHAVYDGEEHRLLHRRRDIQVRGQESCTGLKPFQAGIDQEQTKAEGLMLEWVDVTNHFSEEERYWKGRYLEVDEVANDEIECSLFSCEDDDWEIYFEYGIMYGVCYASAEKARERRSQIMKDIEEEYDRNRMNPSDEFMKSFDEKYHVDVLNALF